MGGRFSLSGIFIQETRITHGCFCALCGLPYQIFKIAREGESQRYKPFRQLHNRKLLWHGSRTTNFAGILSQGLRIAPPEAPVVGTPSSGGNGSPRGLGIGRCCTSLSSPGISSPRHTFLSSSRAGPIPGATAQALALFLEQKCAG